MCHVDTSLLSFQYWEKCYESGSPKIGGIPPKQPVPDDEEHGDLQQPWRPGGRGVKEVASVLPTFPQSGPSGWFPPLW